MIAKMFHFCKCKIKNNCKDMEIYNYEEDQINQINIFVYIQIALQ